MGRPRVVLVVAAALLAGCSGPLFEAQPGTPLAPRSLSTTTEPTVATVAGDTVAPPATPFDAFSAVGAFDAARPGVLAALGAGWAPDLGFNEWPGPTGEGTAADRSGGPTLGCNADGRLTWWSGPATFVWKTGFVQPTDSGALADGGAAAGDARASLYLVRSDDAITAQGIVDTFAFDARLACNFRIDLTMRPRVAKLVPAPPAPPTTTTTTTTVSESSAPAASPKSPATTLAPRPSVVTIPASDRDPVSVAERRSWLDGGAVVLSTASGYVWTQRHVICRPNCDSPSASHRPARSLLHFAVARQGAWLVILTIADGGYVADNAAYTALFGRVIEALSLNVRLAS